MKKILLILSCLLLLVGCSRNSEDVSDKEKVYSEIDYLEASIVDMLNGLNNIKLSNYELTSEKISKQSSNSESSGQSGEQSQSNSGGEQSTSGSSQGGNSESGGKEEKEITITEMEKTNILSTDNEKIDWKTIKSEIELINTSWSIVMYDLKNNNVDDSDINAFGDLLNEAILSIKDENKEDSLTNLTRLYAYIPKFLSAISSEKSIQNIENTKYNVLSAYTSASKEEWDSVDTFLSEAETNFLSIVNDKEYSKNRKFKVNKTNILIKDLKTSSQNKDKQLFFMKYKNLIENLNSF